MPVESLNLTARTLNCLKRASIHKVGEILERNRGELLRIRNFGEKSLEELNSRLGEINIYHPEFGAVDPSEESLEEEDVKADGEVIAADADLTSEDEKE
jgi:DNA-directed RNA polymerase subunit alpha